MTRDEVLRELWNGDIVLTAEERKWIRQALDVQEAPVDDEPDTCSCDICASVRPVSEMTSEERQAYLDEHFAPQNRRSADAEEAVELDALQEELRELTRQRDYLEGENVTLHEELARAEQALSAEQARCQNCGKHK